jgi:hypothetical protein
MTEHFRTCTRFNYRYRDAHNFKVEKSLYFIGAINDAEVAILKAGLFDGEWFVPEQVGLPPLQAELFQFSKGPTDADHALHELVSIEGQNEIEAGGLLSSISMSELLSRFNKAAFTWDVSLSPYA